MAGKEYTTHCGTCGCLRENRTKGCSQCNNRHNKWKNVGDIRYKAPEPPKCKGCGIDMAKINPDCSLCRKRQGKRKYKEERVIDPNEYRSAELTKQHYEAWVQARHERITRHERYPATGRRPIV
nr:MAG TPA: hypothetical protein [Caudoviricetes sp.]